MAVCPGLGHPHRNGIGRGSDGSNSRTTGTCTTECTHSCGWWDGRLMAVAFGGLQAGNLRGFTGVSAPGLRVV